MKLTSVQKQVWSKFRSRCRERKIKVELSSEEYISICGQPCFYCGEEGGNTKILPYDKSQVWYCNGADRIDSTGPYSAENCVPCCQWCNCGKKQQTMKQFIERCKRVAATWG